MKCLSRLSLKVSTRCGWRLWGFQIRWTVAWLSLWARAIVRVLQCVAAGGVVCNVASTTARIFVPDTRGVRPGRGPSRSGPATRRARNRSRHSCTVGRETFRAVAMSWLGTLSAAIVMIFARTTFRYERLRPRVLAYNAARSSGAQTIGAAVLLMLDSIEAAIQ